jgi:hypothetical protein
MILEILNIIAGIIILTFMGYGIWVSTLVLSARKKAYRDGTHDYYGNKIDKDES